MNLPRCSFALLLALSSLSVAQATGPQALTGSGLSQTLDCGGGPVSVSGSSNTVTLTGTCTRVVLTGSGNRLTLTGRVSRLDVEGSSNRVGAQTVGRIRVEGSGNAVSWHRAISGPRPTISMTGSSNSVSKR